MGYFVQGAYMWLDPISSGPTDIGPPNTSHARQTETPDIYKFQFFAFANARALDFIFAKS